MTFHTNRYLSKSSVMQDSYHEQYGHLVSEIWAPVLHVVYTGHAGFVGTPH